MLKDINPDALIKYSALLVKELCVYHKYGRFAYLDISQRLHITSEIYQKADIDWNSIENDPEVKKVKDYITKLFIEEEKKRIREIDSDA
jgi:hypothetical protein